MITMGNIVSIIISHIAYTVYIRFSAFWNFSKFQFVFHLLPFTTFLLRWSAPCLLWWTLFKSSFPTLRTQCISDLECFETFRNCSLFWTFWVLRNFYSGDAHHALYGKHSINHHFQHCEHSVYQSFSVLKLFEIAVCFTPSAFYEISSPVMRTMLTMVNIV